VAETFLQRQARLKGVSGVDASGASFYAGSPGATAAPPPPTTAARPTGPTGAPQTAASQAPNAPPVGTAAAGANQAAIPSYTLTQFQDWQKSRYGRAGTAAEMQRIGAKVGAAGADGSYSQSQYDLGQQESDAIARELGWSGPALTPSAPAAAPAQPAPGGVGHTGRIMVDPGEGYQAGTASVNTGNVGAMNQALMERILANPESLSPDVINQMKAASRDTALSQANQLRGEANANLAGRGFSGGGGMQASMNGAIDQNLLTELLNANRNTDVGAATQNFQDRLNAVGAGSAFQNDATQRELSIFGANQGAQQAQSDDQLRRDQFRADQMNTDRGSNLQEYLGKEGVNLDNRRLTEQQRQFNQTFGFDVTRFLDDMRRDNRNFGEGSRQFNVGAGLNTAQLQQQANNSLLAWLQQAGL
jgi:hypothetical protein